MQCYLLRDGSMSFPNGGLGRWSVVLGLSALLVGGVSVFSAADGPGRTTQVSQKTQKKKVAKKGDDAMAKAEATKAAAPAEGAAADGTRASNGGAHL